MCIIPKQMKRYFVCETFFHFIFYAFLQLTLFVYKQNDLFRLTWLLVIWNGME